MPRAHGGSTTTREARTALPVSVRTRRMLSRSTWTRAVTGVQAEELHDISDQMSVAWVEPLGKWVMFYGGGLTRLPTPVLKQCGVLELFVGAECTAVNMGNGAVRMRTADDPWGPWTPPQDVIAGGVPADGPIGQYGPGGRAAPRGVHRPDVRAAQRHVRLPRRRVRLLLQRQHHRAVDPSRRQRRGHPLERLDVGSVSRGPAQNPHPQVCGACGLWPNGGRAES